MYSRHRKESKVFDRNPSSDSFSAEMLAAKNVERELEVGESLSEGSDKLFDFGGHSHLFLDAIS